MIQEHLIRNIKGGMTLDVLVLFDFGVFNELFQLFEEGNQIRFQLWSEMYER